METVYSVPKEGKVVLYLETGTSSNGNPLSTSRTFANIKRDAGDDEVYAVAVALAKLMKYGLKDVSRVEISDLVSLDG